MMSGSKRKCPVCKVRDGNYHLCKDTGIQRDKDMGCFKDQQVQRQVDKKENQFCSDFNFVFMALITKQCCRCIVCLFFQIFQENSEAVNKNNKNWTYIYCCSVPYSFSLLTKTIASPYKNLLIILIKSHVNYILDNMKTFL